MLALQRSAGNRATVAALRSLRVARFTESAPMPHMMSQLAANELNFCVPFATDAEANASREWLRSTLLPLMTTVFGPEVSDIWRRYLAGGAVVRRTYDDPNSEIVRGFVNDGETISDADRVVAEAWAGVVALGVQPGEVRTVPLSTVLRSTRRSINYRNPISIPGNIAGGEGFGDGGIDTRTVGGSVVVSRSAPASGGWFQRWNHRDITFAQFSLEYTINDTVDFCPGDPGSPLESRFTVPLSRLEATGPQWAVDVPITVRFTLDRHTDNGNPFADPNFNG